MVPFVEMHIAVVLCGSLKKNCQMPIKLSVAVNGPMVRGIPNVNQDMPPLQQVFVVARAQKVWPQAQALVEKILISNYSHHTSMRS